MQEPANQSILRDFTVLSIRRTPSLGGAHYMTSNVVKTPSTTRKPRHLLKLSFFCAGISSFLEKPTSTMKERPERREP